MRIRRTDIDHAFLSYDTGTWYSMVAHAVQKRLSISFQPFTSTFRVAQLTDRRIDQDDLRIILRQMRSARRSKRISTTRISKTLYLFILGWTLVLLGIGVLVKHIPSNPQIETQPTNGSIAAPPDRKPPELPTNNSIPAEKEPKDIPASATNQ